MAGTAQIISALLISNYQQNVWLFGHFLSYWNFLVELDEMLGWIQNMGI
jgi:hypothetical protein|tara:strand:- start:1100 stop:1246 length:147 start_codon:yes stop_codon:yes gene_type:complete